MAYTFPRKPDRNGKVRYTGVYMDLQGRLRSAGTYSTEKKALREAERQEDLQAAGRVGDLQAGKQRFRTYVEKKFLPNHVVELSTKQGYTYEIERYLMPTFGSSPMATIMPGDVREWVATMQRDGVQPPTIEKCKTILDAIFSTAHHEQIIYLHPGRGVKTPPVARRPRRIITAEQFDAVYAELPSDALRLLVETDIESGLRWGELTELRVKDLDFRTGMLTVCRVVVRLTKKFHPEGKRFLVKDYPKDGEWRQLKLPGHLVSKVEAYVKKHALMPADLLFTYEPPVEATRRVVPQTLPDPETLGWSEPNAKGRRYHHGTTTAYAAGKCRCRYCRDAIAVYRAKRRAGGKDEPRTRRVVETDGHISGDWFRKAVWNPAVERANLGFRVTPHGLRHAHASWLLAGGADVQVVKERLGHGKLNTTAQYLGTLPGADDAALAAMDKIRGARSVKRSGDDLAEDSTPARRVEDDKDQKIQELEAKLAKFRALLDT